MSSTIITRKNRNDILEHSECVEILKNILGAEENGKLLSFKIVPELGTIGYLGEYFHVHLNYETEKDKKVKETRVFVKSMPYQNADMSFFIEKSGILKKEATLYETLLNELRKLSKTTWCAQCYLTKPDLFVMQNIVDLGYEPLQESAGYLGTDQMRPLLKGLASMHACSIAYEERNQLSIGEQLKDVLFEVTVDKTVDWYTTGMRAVLAVALKHPLYQSPEHQQFIKDQLSAKVDCVYDMVNPSEKYRNVFCHRDPWGGNVFFNRQRPTEESAVFVDFQLCRYCPAAIDVLFAVYLNIRPEDRKPLESNYYRWYYECFALELLELGLNADEHMSWSQFENSLKDLQLFGPLYNCIAATVLRVPGDYLTEMKQNRPQDFHRYTNVDRTEQVLDLMGKNKEFREYMFECIEDMMKVVLN